jgi:arsenate reductase (thioredoxin)
MLERFRTVCDEIELKIKDWLEHPEQELKKLREERERERTERLATSRWEADEHAQRLAGLTQDGQERHHLPALA